MLNISRNTIIGDISQEKWSGLKRVNDFRSGRLLLRFLVTLSVVFVIALFLPWTQHIRTKGKVTTLLPQQRPQGINTIIPGRIEEWYVMEGDGVTKGDTILHLSEVISEYFDRELLNRTRNQIQAKSSTADAFQSKARALQEQLRALKSSRDAKLRESNNKLQQSQLKVLSDSINLEAKILNFQIAKEQYDRQLRLYNQGLKSLTDLEKRRLTLQKAEADRLSTLNDLESSRAAVNAVIAQIDGIEAQFQEDFSKASSDRFSALSSKYDAQGTVNKLQNSLANYEVRNQFYYITAPQDGIITKTTKAGIGEILEEGEEVATIMPANYELAVELYVRPLDLPLLAKGQEVRLQFDGWPAIIFSGWPNTSYGTFGGRVFAIDNFISENGYYRILIAQSKEEPWPELLRVGGGANGLVLLKDVQVWYEIWRNLNGFPADFYDSNMNSFTSTEKTK